MTDTYESANLVSRIIFALVIVVLAGLFWKVGLSIFSEEAMSATEKTIMILGTILTGLGLLYVGYQRLEMRRNERFRREKW